MFETRLLVATGVVGFGAGPAAIALILYFFVASGEDSTSTLAGMTFFMSCFGIAGLAFVGLPVASVLESRGWGGPLTYLMAGLAGAWVMGLVMTSSGSSSGLFLTVGVVYAAMFWIALKVWDRLMQRSKIDPGARFG